MYILNKCKILLNKYCIYQKCKNPHTYKIFSILEYTIFFVAFCSLTMKYHLRPGAWEAVDFNTVAKISNNTNDKVNDNLVAEFNKNEKKEIEKVSQDNNNNKRKLTYVKYKNKYFLIKKNYKKDIGQNISQSKIKSLSLTKKESKKKIYNIVKQKNILLNNKKEDKDKLDCLATLIIKPPPKSNIENSYNFKRMNLNLSMSIFKINTWFRLYIGYTFLFIYFFFILYYRSQLIMYPVNFKK